MDGREEYIRNNPDKYLVRALKAIVCSDKTELINYLYHIKCLGSSNADRCLSSELTSPHLFNVLTFGILLESMDWETRKDLKFIVKAFGIEDPVRKTVAEVIEALEQLKGDSP